MKQFAKRISALVLVFVLSLAALAPAASAAASLPALPSGQCVVDDAGVLSSSTVQAITDLNAQLESSCNGAQIGVLTVDYTGNYSTEDYATEAFNTWDIGSASENNGVLILLVMESPLYDDGDYYVTYGDGFRNTTLESQASAIAQTMEDDFVRKDYDSAVVTCANNVAETIADIYGVSLSGGSYNDGYYDGGYAEPVDEPTTFGDVVLGIVMLWSGAATLLKGIQPPAWLKGCLTVYAIVTALVAFFLMPPDDPAYVPQVIGIMTNTMLHKIAPIMAVIDFVLFDPHRRFRWHYMFSWLAYFPAYLVFVLARAAIWPGSGPAAGGSPYPYDFINLDALGWQGFGISCGKLAIAFFVISLVVWLLDRALPSKALLG